MLARLAKSAPGASRDSVTVVNAANSDALRTDTKKTFHGGK